MTVRTACTGCRNTDPNSFAIPFTMAFQPIIDLHTATVWGHEALVRGVTGESAFEVLGQINDQNRYAFDQACRVKAIELAGTRLPKGSRSKLSINFMPNAVYEPKACIRATLTAAARVDFDPTRLMFEFTENERITDVGRIRHIVTEYRRMGFLTALDDFGAGYAGLSLLAQFQPDLVKVDMEIIRGIEGSASRQAILGGIITMCRSLGITVLAEGVETEAEVRSLNSAGVGLFQGYYFARPAVETLSTRCDTLLAVAA